MKNLLLKKKILIIPLLLLILVAIPCIINVMYMYGYKNNILPNTMLRASDLLVYLGAIISAIASGALGYIAYTLNKKVLSLTEADTERNKFTTVILETLESKDFPWHAPIQGYNNAYDQICSLGFVKSADIGFFLYNVGPAPLARIVIYYMAGNMVKATVEYNCSLAQNSRKNIQIPLINGQDICLYFEYVSCFNKSTYASCNIVPSSVALTDFNTIIDYQICEQPDFICNKL